MKTTITYTLDLPAPPQWMLDEAQREQDAYEQELFEQCMTIKEFRVLLLPILWKNKATLENHVSLLLRPVWEADAIRMYRRATSRWASNAPHFTNAIEMTPAEYAAWDAGENKIHPGHENYANKMVEVIFNINKYGADKWKTEVCGKHHWSGTWFKMMLPKVEKALAFKSGRLPETRKEKAWQLTYCYNRKTMKPFWECVDILKKNPKMTLAPSRRDMPYLNPLFKN